MRLFSPPAQLIFLIAAISPTAHGLNPAEKLENYSLTRWDTEVGLPHNAIKQLLQTRDGYLWIGTQQGLARFDGITFTTFNSFNTPEFRNNQIVSLAESADGSLWIGTAAGLLRYFEGRFTAFHQDDGLRSETINALCVAPDGSLWIGGRFGITRLVDGRFVNDIDSSAYDTWGLRAIAVDRQKNVWIASGAEALRYRDGAFKRFGKTEGIASDRVQAVCEDAQGRILTVTQNGIFRLEDDRFVPFEENVALSSPRVGSALLDRAGNLWIGSVSGLDRFFGGKVAHYVDRKGGKPGVVDALLEDREGCLWIGTSNGLFRLIDRRAYSLSSEEGVSGSLVTTVAQTRDGAVWIASWGNGIDRFQDGHVSHYGLGAPLSHETTTVIYEAPDGTMWFGNRGSSIDRLDGNKVTTFVYQSGVVSSRPVTAIYGDPKGEFLIGIDRRGLLQLVDGKIVPVPEAAQFSADTVLTIQQLKDGRLLTGTSKGLFERRPDRSWQLVQLPGVKQPIVARSILEDDEGEIWIATDGGGLVRWNREIALVYGTRQGLMDDTFYSVLKDTEGSLWVGSPRGIARIRQSEFAEIGRGGTGSLNPLRLSRVDGLLSASVSSSGGPSGTRLSDGRLLMTTDSGVAVIDPSLIKVNNRPPTVVIERTLADDRPLGGGSAVTVPPGVNRVEIRYTALSLIAPHRLRFRYQLEGSDPGWIEAGHERSAHYTHLAPGSYVFRVRACNSDGIWNDIGASVAVTIQPLFYETLWFQLVAVTLGAGALALLVGLRIRGYRLKQIALARTNSELDQRVRERTQDLQQRELLYRLIFEHAPVGISWKRTDLGSDYHFNSTYRRILDLPSETLPDNSLLAQLVHPDDAPRHAQMEELLRSGKADSFTLEQRFVRKDGQLVWGLLAAAVVRDQQGQIIQVIDLLEDITARKQAEQELAATYKRLVDASRLAGMAEVATGVLHNVGNVLNSVNVSATLLADGLRQSRLGSLLKLTGMLHEHAGDLGTFLTENPKGQRVLPYLDTLADHLGAEQQRYVTEVESLRANIEHIKEIVSRQQSYARLGGLMEKLSPAELVDDALHMNSVSIARHSVKVVREFMLVPPVIAERHKVLQILLNVVQNATQAVKATGRSDGLIRVRLEAREKTVCFSIADNGVGIPPENLTRIFEHGFTTRADGHGFGLHSSANAAKEMHGSLTVRSDGVGRGAVFLLELPIAPENPVAKTPAVISPGTPVSGRS
ncbi:MAG: two-component regulator propeller domain-containing protein [Opitutaceae bacterium]